MTKMLLCYLLLMVMVSGCAGTSITSLECDIGINCTPTPGVTPTP